MRAAEWRQTSYSASSLRAPTFEMAVSAANTGYMASGRTYARALWRNSVRKLSLFNGTEEIWLIDNVRAVLQVNRSEPMSTVDKRRNNGGFPWRRHNVPAAKVFFTEYTFRRNLYNAKYKFITQKSKIRVLLFHLFPESLENG